MEFIREIETREVSESDNVWADTGWEDEPRAQVIGTVVTCRVMDAETNRMSQMSITVSPDNTLEDECVKELIEECYRACEISLYRH
jgi:hypothetical protein